MEEVDVQQRFEDFFKAEEYRERLAQLGLEGRSSIRLNFERLVQFDSGLAEALMEHPDEFLQHISNGAFSQLQIEDPEYAEKVKGLKVRVYNLFEATPLRSIGAEHIAKLVMVKGVVVKATDVKPRVVNVAFECKRCGTRMFVEQTTSSLTTPFRCSNPTCGRKGPFEMVKEECEYVNFQKIWLQERPEELPPGQLPQSLRVRVIGDLVNVARPGDDVSVVGIVRVQPQVFGNVKLTTFDVWLEANSIEVLGKEPEAVPTAEEVRLINELAEEPWVHRNVMASIAPSIYGYEEIKEAIMYLLFGGVAKTLPDMKVRGELNVLLIGDPSCISGDSRVVLRDGTLPKIQTLGSHHLEEIRVPVYSAKGGRKCAYAEQFHVYHGQPVLELITESGRRLVGTYNQCLLVKKCINGEYLDPRISWRRMDELQVGDEIRVVPKIHCFKKSSPISVELAALFGYKLADGWSDKYRVGFVVNNEERDLIKKLQKFLLKEFGKKATIYKRMTLPSWSRPNILHKPKPIYYLEINGKEIASRFNRELEKLCQSSDAVVAVALSWLFEGDGHILKKGRGKNGVFLKQGVEKDIETLRLIQLLLLRFGVYSTVNEDAEGVKWLKIRQSNSIERFAEYIGFQSEKKKQSLKKLVKMLPKRKRFHNKLWERIKTLRPLGVMTVYDIVEPKYQQFVANGIVVHNTGKSQLLRYVAKVAPRGVYTSGRGTTAAGLTAAVLREKGFGHYSLQAGALVLADKGVTCIDEIEKMREDDRHAIHEPLEQHTVSIAKGGIVATLNARTAVLAAANPLLGRYDPYRGVAANFSLPVALLSRFDLIFLMLDVPDPERDAKIAEHILGLHMGVVPEPPIEPSLLRKYIAYARGVDPVVSREARERLDEFYRRMRKVSGKSEGTPIAISWRQLEALVRIAEARARVALRKTVTVEDAEAAIRIMTKSLEQVGIDVTTGRVDIDLIMTGKPKSFRDRVGVLLDVLIEMERETGMVAKEDLLDELEHKYGIARKQGERVIQDLIKEGSLYSPRDGYVKKA